mmetsp:Transcript_49388/g.163581  ORF Transcript_49388/g.163581 Transcript_49388/m.163581 type:complete len:243 (-) Transcript_49388:454-1182(-)
MIHGFGIPGASLFHAPFMPCGGVVRIRCSPTASSIASSSSEPGATTCSRQVRANSSFRPTVSTTACVASSSAAASGRGRRTTHLLAWCTPPMRCRLELTTTCGCVAWAGPRERTWSLRKTSRPGSTSLMELRRFFPRSSPSSSGFASAWERLCASRDRSRAKKPPSSATRRASRCSCSTACGGVPLCTYGRPLPTGIHPSHGSPGRAGCGVTRGGISRLSTRAAASAGEHHSVNLTPRLSRS